MERHWSETLPEGSSVRMGFLAVDLAGSGRLAEPDRRNFQRTVDQVVLEFGGALLPWSGDGTMGFFYDPEGLPEVAAFRAGRRLVERLLSEHGLTSHVGLHSGVVVFRKDLGRDLHAGALNQAGHLGKAAPPGMILISSEAAEALEEADRALLGFFGTTRRDGVPCFSWPRKPGAEPDPGVFFPGREDLWEARTRYLDQVRGESRLVRLVGPRRIQKVPTLEILSIFVPPTLERLQSRGLPEEDAEAVLASGREEAAEAPHEPAHPRTPRPARARPPHRLGLEEALRRHRALALVGDPGSGKTTLLRWLAHVVASGRRRVQEKRLTPLEGLVPILAPAGALHTLLEGGRSVSDALGRYWESLDVEGCGALFQRLIEERSALVLVDGLDEVPDAAGRVTLARKLGDFTRRHPGVRVIVTSRRVGFDALVLGAWEPFEVAPFGPDQIRALAERWFVECEKARTIETPDVVRRGGRNAEEFLRAVEGHPRLKDLLRNPLLLTLACLVQRQGGRLPRYRVELYDLIGQTLIETWDAVRSLDARPVGPVGRDYRKEARDVLWPLARSLHGRAGGDVVSEGELVELLAERLRAGAVSAPEAAGAAHRFIEELRKATHLLLERGPGQWAFMHPTFQEFFCAQSIAAAESPVEEILPHVYDPRWREVIRLVAGVLGVLHGRAPAVTRLVRAILDSDDPLRGRILRHNLWLAADCLTDAGGAEPDTVHEVVEELTAVALDPQGGGYFRDRAAKRVGALFEVTGVARVEPFLEATKSRDAPVRATAVTVLGAMRRADPDLIRLLLGMLGDADWGVRSAAADALAAIAPTKPAAVQALLDRLGDADPLVASGAAEALGSLGSAEPRVIQALMDGLAAEVWLVRSASARALGRVGRAQPGVVQALLRSLDDKEAPVRSAAAAALGRLGASDPNVVQALMARIEDTDPLVILEAAEALTVMRAGQPDAVQALLRRLEDKSLLVRWAATRALGCVGAGDPRAVEALLGRLHDEHWRVCLAAARALGASSPGVLGAILELLEHQEWEVRWAAAEALGELGATEPGVIQGLLQRLGDAHPWVGLSAAEALGELGAAAHRVVQALLSALTDEAQGVRSAAAGALDRIAALNPDLQLPAPDAGDQPGS